MASTMQSSEQRSLVRSVRRAQRKVGTVEGEFRSRALVALGDLLQEREELLLAANAKDLRAAEEDRLAGPLLKRLELTPAKLSTLREGVLQLSRQQDPIGRVLRRTELDDGLQLKQVTSPLGVLLIIFESRPDAAIQIGSLALRSGNAVLLKGGTEALHSNRALVGCLQDALTAASLPPAAVVGIEGRDTVGKLLEFDHDIDLVIPRGSGQLVRSIQNSTRIPVLGHAEGICHLYLDAAADPKMAAHLAVDGKCDYPAACNATETLLVHEHFLPHLPIVARALTEKGVTLKTDAKARACIENVETATAEDWSTEWGDLTLSVRAVSSIEQAVEHIHRYGSGHTDAIVTDDVSTAERFLREVDSASVFVNASTRFADGYRYGLGAEVGISTGRIHARGPVGVDGLLTTRWLLQGSGQGTGDYGPGRRQFKHRPL